METGGLVFRRLIIPYFVIFLPPLVSRVSNRTEDWMWQ